MAKLYGLGNVIVSDVLTRLITNPDFYKLVYYKDVDEEGEDILSMPDLEDPVSTLYKKQVWLHRRPDKTLHNQDVNVFITLEDFRNESAKNQNIKTMTFKVAVLVHKECLLTPNGSRDIALLCCISDTLLLLLGFLVRRLSFFVSFLIVANFLILFPFVDPYIP